MSWDAKAIGETKVKTKGQGINSQKSQKLSFKQGNINCYPKCSSLPGSYV